MVDIHAHILPEVDDGSHDMEESVEMARTAYESGTEYLVLTPHVNAPGIDGNYWGREMHARYADFRGAVHAAGIPIRIGYGAEVFYTPEMGALLREGKLLPMAGTRYFLIEFAFDVTPHVIREALETVARAELIPILAHPERYKMTARDPRAIFDWVRSGCLMQLNKDSLLGVFGHEISETAHLLLSHGLAHCIASDAHHADYRTPRLDRVYRYVEQIYGTETAEVLLSENPGRLVRNEALQKRPIMGF